MATKKISPTIPLGKQVHVTLSNGILTDVSCDGDMYWGRTGRYITSYFLLEAVLVNNIRKKSFADAVQSIHKISVSTIQQFNSPDCPFPADFESYLNQLLDDCQDVLSRKITDAQEQVAILNDLGTRYLDLSVHKPLAFIECKTDPAEERKRLAMQKKALGFLDSVEKSLQGQDDDEDEDEDDDF